MAMGIVQQLPKSGRRNRYPSHSWHLRHRPYTIQPFMIAPVLPGETLKSGVMQARVVTDPIKNPLIGWWIEYYWFYVKHRDLTPIVGDEFEQMVLDPSWTPDNVDEVSADPITYFPGAGINWVRLCMRRCVEEYFRDEGEAWDAYTIDGLPIASINSESWLNSAILQSDYVAPDFDADLNADDTYTVSEIDAAMRQYEILRSNNLTQMSYEDFLTTYGVRPKSVELHRPELLRYVRDWSYPTNTVDPSTGAPSSAVSWSVAERLDKDRFFKEPGFIIGLTVARPKVYLSGQSGAAAWALNDAYSWLPAILMDDPATSFKSIAEGAGPLKDIALAGTTGYFVDLRDLFIYGDQFINFATTETNAGLVALPDANMQKRYVSEVSMEALFVTADVDKVKQDGVCSLTVASRLEDLTPRT